MTIYNRSWEPAASLEKNLSDLVLENEFPNASLSTAYLSILNAAMVRIKVAKKCGFSMHQTR